ncbi:MAG: hypothetical protein V8S08_07410 [Lachnoclostridium sp.]
MFDDGEFEVTLIKSPKNPIELNELVAALVLKQADPKHMYTFKTGHIKFESIEEIPWTLDGEYGGSHDTVEIRDAKKALQIMVVRKGWRIFRLTIRNERVCEVQQTTEKFS